MPGPASPPSGPRRDRDRDRSRSRSPPRGPARKPKELSFYKKSSASSSMGSFSQRRDPLDEMSGESAKDRMERRDRGEVPARFGGTREQGVRNTMSSVAPHGTANTSMGSFKRGSDPLDRMGVRGRGGDRAAGREGDVGRERDGGVERDGGRDGYRRDARYRDDERDREKRRSGARDRDMGRDKEVEREDRKAKPDGDRQRDERIAAMDKTERRPPAVSTSAPSAASMRFIEIIANDRMGRKVRIKCLPSDTVGDLKRLIAAQTGTTAQKIQLKKWYNVFKDHVTLRDYEINDGMSLEMY